MSLWFFRIDQLLADFRLLLNWTAVWSALSNALAEGQCTRNPMVFLACYQ